MWYGEFIHGMMERTFRLWQDRGGLVFPLPCTLPSEDERPGEPSEGLDPFDLRVIGWPIEQALAHQGKIARSRDARISAYERAEAAINQLGPHLFPLIDVAERKVIGTRALPVGAGVLQRASRYVLQGIIDVLGHAQLDGQPAGNPLKEAIFAVAPHLQGEYEIIIDYKGSRRPPVENSPRSDWQLGEWQVQTYAWLRSQQVEARPIAAGVLIYVSELQPGSKELSNLKQEMKAGRTDVFPAAGTQDYYQLNAWGPGRHADFTPEFRLKRAIRVVPVTPDTMNSATAAIDRVVRTIEDRVSDESQCENIRNAWPADSNDRDTCIACDFRASCERHNDARW